MTSFRMYLPVLGLFFTLLSCSEENVPRPPGYFRIELPADEYTTYETDCPFTFVYQEDVQLRAKKEHCWTDLYFPSIQSVIQLTYKPINNNLDTLLNDAHQLVYRHTVKASGIEERSFTHAEEDVYGILYKLHGESATHTQFFLTDSNQHFLRGVVYFNAIPNPDSLAPVNAYMQSEVEKLINSFKWKNSSP